jgi:hypothetical protein
MSLLQTCQQSNVNPLSAFTTILRSPNRPPTLVAGGHEQRRRCCAASLAKKLS